MGAKGRHICTAREARAASSGGGEVGGSEVGSGEAGGSDGGSAGNGEIGGEVGGEDDGGRGLGSMGWDAGGWVRGAARAPRGAAPRSKEAAGTAVKTAVAPQTPIGKMPARCPPGRCSSAAPGRCLSHARDSTAPLDEGHGRQGIERVWVRIARCPPQLEEDVDGRVPG